MQMYIKKQIGKEVINFVVEGDNLHKVVMESRKLSFPNVYKCGLCGSDTLALSAHLAGKKDEYKYTDIKCLKCKASLTFGQTKEDADVFYLRKNDKGEFDWKPYAGKEQNNKQEERDMPF